MLHSKPLLHDVLRSQGLDQLTNKLQRASLLETVSNESDDSDEELVAVQSIPATPVRSRAASRASSPSRATTRPIPGPLHLSTRRKAPSDPLRAFPTEIGQCIFRLLSIYDLARCSMVCKKWRTSQTLNYVWFQHFRRDTFNDLEIRPGKWTRRESKQNWRQMFIKEGQTLRDSSSALTASSISTSSISTSTSGALTPREQREDRWRIEAETKPGKLEMRAMYKEHAGRKVRGKGKLISGVGGGGSRDRGGWEDGGVEDW